MSASLEKIAQMRQAQQQIGLSPQQKRHAESDLMMQLSASMGDPNIQGQGMDRMLSVLSSGIGPGFDAYKASESKSLENNRALMREARLEEKEAKREAREERKLGIMERKLSSNGGSDSNGNFKERRVLWNALGTDAKAEEYRKGMILNWSPTKTQENFLKGIHPEEVAAEQGIKLEEHEGSYLLTGNGRNQIKQAEGIEAEIDSLSRATSKDLSYFSGPSLPKVLGGANIKETYDSLTGKNKEKRLRALGARSLQPEIAGARSRFAQSSSAQEAIHGMQKAALASVEIFEPNISSEDREFVQNYINEALSNAFTARKRAVMGLKKEHKEDKGSYFNSAPSDSRREENETKKLESKKKITIVDDETGETRVVSVQEAKALGAM